MRLFGVLTSVLFLMACGKSSEQKAAPDAGAPLDGAAPDGGGTVDAGGSDGGACAATGAAAVRGCVEQSRLQADVTFVAKPRAPGTAHWQAVQDLCADRFAQHGFEVERHKYATGVNVIGKKPGTSKAAEHVIVSAHYDSTPGCPGADDNATGVGAVLEAARVLGPLSFERTLVLACWDEEEDGLIGAEAYAKRAKVAGDKVVVMTSLEMIGYKDDAPNTQQLPTGLDLLFPKEYQQLKDDQFRANFVAVVGLDVSQSQMDAFVKHAGAVQLPVVVLSLTPAQANNPLLHDLQRSDHAAFWQEGMPGIMVTDTSNFRYKQYHCGAGQDDVSRLDFSFMTRVTQAQIGATVDALGLK